MDVKIIKVEEYPNCKKITVEATIDKHIYTQRFSVSPEQYANGAYKIHIENWVKSVENKDEMHFKEGEKIKF